MRTLGRSRSARPTLTLSCKASATCHHAGHYFAARASRVSPFIHFALAGFSSDFLRMRQAANPLETRYESKLTSKQERHDAFANVVGARGTTARKRDVCGAIHDAPFVRCLLSLQRCRKSIKQSTLSQSKRQDRC